MGGGAGSGAEKKSYSSYKPMTSGGKASFLIYVAIACVIFVISYNLATMIIYNYQHIYCNNNNNSAFPVKKSSWRVARREGKKRNLGKTYHVAVTASGTAYSQWQCRIMYYWYNKFKKNGVGSESSDMGGFTRILHSGKPDKFMFEIPTFLVDPLPNGLDLGYVVLNRPWAFIQWLIKATIEEEYILMAEPDHMLVKPLPNLAAAWNSPVAYRFLYITPKKYQKIIEKYYPVERGPVTDIDPIGNSPVLITKSLLKEIAPTWMNLSLRIRNDPESDRAFGWVQEMYAYAVASALHGVKHTLYRHFMVQPPVDKKVGNAYIIHFTYGCEFTNKGELLTGKHGELVTGEGGFWGFNKRDYLYLPPPKNISLPPTGAPESEVRLVKMINEATANIPGWEIAGSYG